MLIVKIIQRNCGRKSSRIMDNFNHEILEHNTSKQSNKQNTQKTTKEKGTGGGGGGGGGGGKGIML